MRPTSRDWRLALRAMVVVMLALACGEQGRILLLQTSIDVERFDLVSERSLAPTVVESTYRARCRAEGGPYDDVIVFVNTEAVGVELVDAVARCGPLGAGSARDSVETIVLKRDPTRPFDPNTLGRAIVAYGPHTRVADEPAPGGARRLRYEVEVADTSGLREIAVGVASASPSITVLDGLVTAFTQRASTVRNVETFEVLVAAGAPFDPAGLVWTLSSGLRDEFALGVTRTLDGAGQPLGGVQIEEQGPGGAALGISESATGLATLALTAGAFHWRFSREGHLPVWREATLAAGQVLSVPSPWLAARSSTPPAALSVLNGGEVAAEGALVRFGAGALPAPASATLTPIGGQSLPGLLPAGWSPLAAFWLELSVEPQAPGQAELTLAERLAPGERAFLARFDPTTRRWIETGSPVAVSGTLATAALAASGGYAIVVADVGPTAPPMPAAGAALEPTGTPFPLPDGLAATGTVTPAVAAASEEPALVTARSEVVVRHAGPLPSGLVLRANADERYLLRDGTTRTTPSYETFFVAYQRPGDGDPLTLHARFPLRPQLALGPEVLDEARVALEVLPVTAFAGGFFGPNGGRVHAPGVMIWAGPGAVDRIRAVELRALDPAGIVAGLPPGAALVAFELGVELREGASVEAVFDPQEPNAHFVLARLVQSGARSGLEPRARYRTDERGFLHDAEPTSGPRLAGIAGAGTYVLVRVDGPRALVEGIARDGQGQPAEGLAVTITGEPWLTFSGVGGRWQLVAPVGLAEVVVTDPRNGDRGTSSVLLADAASVGSADLATQPAGPRVVETDPQEGATSARPSTPIRVVFSEPVAPLVPGDLVLTDAQGDPVAATLSTNLARSEATLLPVHPLASGALHTLTLAATIADPTGLPLEGPSSFTFTTQSAAARGAGAQLVSWEPGAQTSECDDVPGFDPANPAISCAVGSPGTADPDVPVVLVNETRGTTATVRSRLDGSFENFIEADVDDFLAATFVNGNDTRIRVPLSRQLFDDGSVALFQGGGILEAESDGGPVQVQIEPGAIKSKNKFRVEPLDAAALLAMLQDSPPQDAALLGTGLRVTVEGEPPAGEANLSFPLDPATIELPPGVPPEEGAFAAAIVRETEGGAAYQVVDKLRFADGQIASNTPPSSASSPSWTTRRIW